MGKKTSELPTDSEAPAATDLIAFTDVSASRSEKMTVTELAESTAFTSQFVPLAASKLLVPWQAFYNQSGTVVTADVNDGTYQYRYWSLVNGSTRVVVADNISVPDHWATFTVHEITVNPTAGTGNVALDRRISSNFYGDGDLIKVPTGAEAVSLSTTVKAAGTQHAIEIDQVGSAVTNVPGERFTLVMRRNTGSDTLAATYGFLGYELRAASFA